MNASEKTELDARNEIDFSAYKCACNECAET